jgi:hypothetical protein
MSSDERLRVVQALAKELLSVSSKYANNSLVFDLLQA